ncbi:MAG: NIF family HAD-type phosphatase, partial [Nannocystaceae bacterium]
ACSLVSMLVGLIACAPPTPTTAPPDRQSSAVPSADQLELAAMTLDPRPDWADKYAGSSPDERFFDIAELMATHGLDRAQAIELQNHFRDLSRAQPQGDRQAQYAEALRRVQAGIFEDGRDTQHLAEARFIVVFDLDETLYDQYFDDPAVAQACRDFVSTDAKGKERSVKINPGLPQALDRIHALGGAVLLFSANVDDTCWANAKVWTVGDTPILEHPAVAGMLTNSHLVVQPKHAGDPVVEPSKDLRVVDETLERAIIVDDNPGRLFQFRNVRVFKKFQADQYCTTGDPDAKLAYETALKVVVDEIEDSVRYMEAHPGTGFTQAYAPYTDLGRNAVHWLQTGAQRTEREAIDTLRARPQLIDAEY